MEILMGTYQETPIIYKVHRTQAAAAPFSTKETTGRNDDELSKAGCCPLHFNIADLHFCSSRSTVNMEKNCLPNSKKRSELIQPLSDILTMVLFGAPNSHSTLSHFPLKMIISIP
ncbi:hypothetical protein AAFF_G00233080 [Aldrovandia affinis]|uniref:Uncharacterized protein n=1 Tax=Aldrovandia affinis TaxID=143900 RepID=A0AAD7RF38_9TELE|nr:hypothetical protein AAFF_G00233080 [Aldrovandia affinis]